MLVSTSGSCKCIRASLRETERIQRTKIVTHGHTHTHRTKCQSKFGRKCVDQRISRKLSARATETSVCSVFCESFSIDAKLCTIHI